jgi:hypothetical protein
MQRWEHCSIFSNRITFYRVSGTTVHQIKRDKAQGDRDDDDAYNRAIAQLGLDGWEYVGMSGLQSWFKRPLP